MWYGHLVFVYISISFVPQIASAVALIITMMIKTIIFLTCLVHCMSVLYSSFWAPLFDPRILNYRVDAKFDPDSGRNARQLYKNKYGSRAELLISDLGNGKGVRDPTQDYQGYGDVKLTYTYRGAN